MKDFITYLNEAIGHAIGQTITRFAICFDEKPRWLRRIKEGHVLPWMVPRTRNMTMLHASVVMNRMLMSLRVQTHTVK